jgi:hypothetical protein
MRQRSLPCASKRKDEFLCARLLFVALRIAKHHVEPMLVDRLLETIDFGDADVELSLPSSRASPGCPPLVGVNYPDRRIESSVLLPLMPCCLM